MQFSQVYRRAGVIIVIALAAASIFASAASAMPLEGPVHQIETTSSAAPATHAPVNQTSFRQAEAQAAQDYPRVARTYWFNAPTAPFNGPAVNARVKPVPAVPAAKIAAPSNSFDWGDAAIGAGIAVAIVFLVTGGALVARRRTQLGEA
ncbi:MAG: hypothetical protein JO325_17630 [Solirubrobacterales bacterium]|nr:hypothetical protein [Solirubrobacterales bacterium]